MFRLHLSIYIDKSDNILIIFFIKIEPICFE